MRQTFSFGDPARVARRHNLRRRTRRQEATFRVPPALSKPGSGPPQAIETNWLAPFNEEEAKALRAAWSFVE